MTRYLIVNADDYARTPAVAQGIRHAHKFGIVTSTSIMTNMPNTGDDLGLAIMETPDLDLGVHLSLTAGKPLCDPKDVKSLVDEEGNFWSLKEFIIRLDRLSISDIKQEWQAQVNFFIDNANRRPSHLDSHQHTSYFTPDLFRLMLELAKFHHCAIRYAVPLLGIYNTLDIARKWCTGMQKTSPGDMFEYKLPHPDKFVDSFYDKSATKEHLLTIIASLPEGITELMCHPGFVDQMISAVSSYNHQREKELSILTDSDIKSALRRFNVTLTSFKECWQKNLEN